MIILGVDPSLSNTGYGILESVESKLKPIEGTIHQIY